MAKVEMTYLNSSGTYETIYPKVDLSNITGTLPVANGGTGTTSLNSLMTNMGAARIQTGSYVGTGTYGASNPCSLTFNFTPTFFQVAMINDDYPENFLTISQGNKYSSNIVYLLDLTRVPNEYNQYSTDVNSVVKGIGFPFSENITVYTNGVRGSCTYYLSRVKFINNILSWFAISGYSENKPYVEYWTDSSNYQLNETKRKYFYIAF